MDSPASFEVMASSIDGLVDEMSEVLRRSAYSPVVREMLDYSCALLDARGRVVAQADNIPAQLGAMAHLVDAIEEANPLQTWADGDVFLVNDPYRGAAHTPDIFAFSPIFLGGDLAAWAGTCAHHVDVGGRNPGTEGADNRSVFEEGLLLPSVRLMRAGRPVEETWRIIEANVREPSTTLGDLRAQLAALSTARRRVEELAGRFGSDRLLEAMADVQDYSERLSRAALRDLPDGDAEAEGFMDDDGAGGPPVRIHCRIRKRGDRLLVDLAGTDRQRDGGMNCPLVSTEATVYYAVRAVVGSDIPVNDGFFRPIELVIPEGSYLNPRFPGAVSVRHLTCQRLADTLIRAFGGLAPERVNAGSFVGFFSIMAAGPSPLHGGTVVIQDILGGGMGARRGLDGLDAVDTHVSNCALLPAEVCETLYPWRIERTELIRDSGGPGEFRGGLGLRRVYRALTGQQTVLYIDQTEPRFAPRGLSGGNAGAPSRIRVRADGRRPGAARSGTPTSPTRVPMKTTVFVPEGASITVETAGGGGWGSPRDRRPDAVGKDLREGVVSRRGAEAYGKHRGGSRRRR